MFRNIFVLFVLSSVFSTSYTVEWKECAEDEFECEDGECVSLDNICTGKKICKDGSDLHICDNHPHLVASSITLLRRKRQTTCRKTQWQCRDGSCIGIDEKCDGVADCPDGSDETHPLCRKMQCLNYWFRCTYGACVDGTAPCNGIQECADNSDELLPRCRNETEEVKGQFRCQNGQVIYAAEHCDGTVHCSDGSDETVGVCAAKTCPSYLFQCAYGACVDHGSDCNGVQDCADGSDESDELCNRMASVTPTINPIPGGGKCVLPPYPKHGTYVVKGRNAKPGQTVYSAFLEISCDSDFDVENTGINTDTKNNSIFCYEGMWSRPMPRCVRYCRLPKEASVEYRCLVTGSVEGSRECRPMEPSGTVVKPVCSSPNYDYSGILPFMRCIDGSWDYVPRCDPECGTITPEGTKLIYGGRTADRGELPWHAGIYRKLTNPYMQICGGSLIRTTTVISAAHCFWSDFNKKESESIYAVAVGKLYRPWNNPRDSDAQKSDVARIEVPPRFQGSATNFQDDIAIVIVVTPFKYQVFIRPVCINFVVDFNKQQLREPNLGKVAGWGLSTKNGKPSQILKVVELPYVNIDVCIAKVPPDFRAFITSDKICAGYTNGTTLCQGDSGGGLAFPTTERGTQRYYLRGIVSTAPRNDDLCNIGTLTTFTQIMNHEHFIREFSPTNSS